MSTGLDILLAAHDSVATEPHDEAFLDDIIAALRQREPRQLSPSEAGRLGHLLATVVVKDF